MKFIAVISFCVLFMVTSFSGFGQKEVVIDGAKYVLHVVSKSETVYGLCQKYELTPKDIQQANPGFDGILKVGSTIKIPVGKVDDKSISQVKKNIQPAEPEFYYHKVAKNQTIVSIAKQYATTPNDLIRNNPDLTKGLQLGQVLKIPVAEKSVSKTNGPAGSIEIAQIEAFKSRIHQVASGETLFGLEQRYGITHEKMLAANPELQNGLRAGMKLNIPEANTEQTSEPPVSKNGLAKYKVEKGETLFSIAARFGVEVSDIKKVNPSLLSRSLESGETILIPELAVKGGPEIASIEGLSNPTTSVQADCVPSVINKSRKYKVGFLLPFYLSNIDSLGDGKAHIIDPLRFETKLLPVRNDSIVVVGSANIDQRVTGFMEFYEGALIAVDSLRRLGMNIEIYAFDAGNQDKINQLLSLDQFIELDMIIGPVYPELQQRVASFAAKNRIPMISPLSASGNLEKGNPWYFKVNPTRDYQIEQTVSYASREFARKNFFLLHVDGTQNNSEAQLGRLVKEKFSESVDNRFFHEYNFQQQGVNSIRSLLDEDGENVFMIPTDNEAQVSVAVTNLTALAEHYNILLVGSSNLVKLKSIQTENYHKVRLRFLSPYFVDYERPLVKRFVGQYRDIFSAEPTQFSFQGFDVSFYFLNVLARFGNDFRDCISNYPMELTQMNFSFDRAAPMGGFSNQSLYITSYERNFDITNQGIIRAK